MRLTDRASGLFLVALGALAAYGGSRLPPVPGQQVGPNVFPMVVGVGLVLCGILIALGVGRGFEAQPVVAPGAGDGRSDAEAPVARNGLWALLPPALLLFYVFASERLGFVVAAAILVFIASFSLGARLKLAVAVTVLAPPAVHLIFAKLLRVPLPPGLLPMPW